MTLNHWIKVFKNETTKSIIIYICSTSRLFNLTHYIITWGFVTVKNHIFFSQLGGHTSEIQACLSCIFSAKWVIPKNHCCPPNVCVRPSSQKILYIIYIYALNLNTKHSPLSTTTINASVRTLYHHHPSSSSFKKLRISSACQGSEKKTKKALLEGVLILLINAGGQTCYLEFYIILAYLKSSCIV
jgi:hypothetical protein